MSRLADLRQGIENRDTLSRMQANARAEVRRSGAGISIESREGRRQALAHLNAERAVDHMSQVIDQRVPSAVTGQELKDAAFLLERASRWS